MDTGTRPQIIAVWAADDDPQQAQAFDPDLFADWAELNSLSGAFPDPTRFYGITPDGALVELWHTASVGPYDGDDFATVTHTWTSANDPTCPYATGTTRRDGRA